jgi:TonB family protein
MIGTNALAWCIQIALVVAAAALAAVLLRMRAPGVRLLFWHLVLLACLALPLLRPWKHEVVSGNVAVSTIVLATRNGPAEHRAIPPSEILLALVAAGILVRGVWLAVGFWRLGRYRRRSQPFGTRGSAALLLSADVSSPVTFGALRPVVLLPALFPEFEPEVREAILCHELLHVERRDWLFMVGEELVRAIFWFHPAIWWLLGEIGLAREQEVDRRVVQMTSRREEYVDALLAIAGAGARLDLAPAPLFLRKRHLKARVISILKEVRMSRTRSVSSLAAALTAVAVTAWLISAVFPLSAAPEAVADSPGVSIDIGPAALMHRTPVVYPEGAREQGVQGTVVVQAALDAKGNVIDAQVLSGPDELRNAALQSVVNWHFAADGSTRTRQISISFQPGYAKAVPKPVLVSPSPLANLVVGSIVVTGLSDAARAELLSKLPVRQGAVLSNADIPAITAAAAAYDQHLRVTFRTPMTGQAANLQSGREVSIEIAPGTSPTFRTAVPAQGAAPQSGREASVELAPGPPSTPLPADGPRLRVGGNMQSTKLVKQPRPQYPPEAKQARIQGVVKLYAIIGKDGTVQNLTVISGDPLLVPSALEAVRQWVYEPTLLNGNPVEVDTEIDVNYTLAQ